MEKEVVAKEKMATKKRVAGGIMWVRRDSIPCYHYYYLVSSNYYASN